LSRETTTRSPRSLVFAGRLLEIGRRVVGVSTRVGVVNGFGTAAIVGGVPLAVEPRRVMEVVADGFGATVVEGFCAVATGFCAVATGFCAVTTGFCAVTTGFCEPAVVPVGRVAAPVGFAVVGTDDLSVASGEPVPRGRVRSESAFVVGAGPLRRDPLAACGAEPFRCVALVAVLVGVGDEERDVAPAGSRVRSACAPMLAPRRDGRSALAVGRGPPVEVGAVVVGRGVLAYELARVAFEVARCAAAEDCWLARAAFAAAVPELLWIGVDAPFGCAAAGALASHTANTTESTARIRTVIVIPFPTMSEVVYKRLHAVYGRCPSDRDDAGSSRDLHGNFQWGPQASHRRAQLRLPSRLAERSEVSRLIRLGGVGGRSPLTLTLGYANPERPLGQITPSSAASCSGSAPSPGSARSRPVSPVAARRAPVSSSASRRWRTSARGASPRPTACAKRRSAAAANTS
jgi:hypothetical protein